MGLTRRIVVVVALGLWLGGITLYGLVVVPAGVKVLGSATAQGFVTQEVISRLNVLAVVALAGLAWNTLATRTRALVATWLVMIAAQVALFLLQPYVSALLDATTHQVSDHAAFYARHRIYLLVTTVQWLAALAYAGFALARWRVEDRR